MLMADSCHPAVLNLLPFTSNDASNAKALLGSGDLYAREDIRVFPVLAVTRRRRKDNDGMAPNAGPRPTAMLDSDSFRPTRVSSERCSRRQTTDDDLLKAARPRVKSEYDVQRSVAADSVPRDPATCAVANINERIVALRASPRAEDARRQGQGHAWMPLDGVGASGVEGVHPPPHGWTLPKPALTSSMVAFNGDGVDRDEVDGKHPLLRHPLWRSVTLTPGELDLMKHREHVKGLQVYRGIPTTTSNSSNIKLSGSSKRFKGSKLNVRDLPRSTTPLNDHDPDRLNMKQVIAFLQSTGASVADAVQLSSDPAATDDSCSAPSRRPSKVLVSRRGVSQSSASVSLGAERADDGASVLPSVTSGRRAGDGEQPVSRKVRDGQSERSQHAPLPDRATVSRCSSADARGEVTTRKRQQQQQQRPFRLHRFLTMVPAPNDEFQQATHVPSNLPNSRLARKLRGDAALDKPVPEECVKRLSSFGRHHPLLPDVDSGATCASSAEVKFTYRLSSRRPTSPDVTLKEDPTQVDGISAGSDGPRKTVFDDLFDDKNVIRLPNVPVDSDEEDGLGEENVSFANTQKPKPKMAASQIPAKKTTTKTISVSNRSEHKQELSAQRSHLSNGDLVASPNRSPARCDVANERHDTHAIQKEPGSDVTEDSKEKRFQETAQERATTSCTRQVRIKLPRESDKEEKSLVRKHPPDIVTLSLRKERTRTREHTYMSDIAGSNKSEGALGPAQVT